jgi:Fic family protein
MRGVDHNKTRSSLGFAWDSSTVPDLPAHGPKRALWRFSRTLPAYVWDAAVLEGNPFTYPEVQTLLEGVTVGGRRLSDERQILSLSASATNLHTLVESRQFALSKETSDNLNRLIAQYEALEAGHFRGEGHELANVSVSLGEHGTHHPPPTEPGGENLRRIYDQGTAFITNEVPGVFERAGAYFLFGAFMQFYFDGNKRTARYMMNGLLMSHGIDAISIPAARKQEFNEEMIDFYRSKDGTRMLSFLASCHAEAEQA